MTETVEQRIQSLEKHLSSQPRSPLFAQLAGYYLDAGKAREALDLCDKGLSLYPFYSTGHLIKGKALLGLNMPAEARREFEMVQGFFPALDSLNRLLRDLPSQDIGAITESPQPQPVKAKTVESPPTAKQQPAEPITAEANPDQWLSQFTEAAAPVAAVEAPQTVESTESPVSPETFSFTGEAAETPPVEVSTADDAFGLAAPQESTQTAFEAPQETTQTGESFQDFAERKRGELFGLQNSMSLEDFLAGGKMPDEALPESPEVSVAPEVAQVPTEDPFATLTQQSEEAPIEVVQETAEPPAEDPFAALTQQFEETPAEAVPEAATDIPVTQTPADDPFAALTQQFEETPAEVIPESPETPVAAEDAQTPAEDPFASLTQQFEEPLVETQPEQAPVESYSQPEQPAGEAPAPLEQSTREKTDIEELADKLKNAKRITPIIDLTERTTVPPSESETPSSTGFVTPTLAEIYAKQGWYDDAIKAYRTLAVSKPAEKDKFERRIQELEELKKKQESG